MVAAVVVTATRVSAGAVKEAELAAKAAVAVVEVVVAVTDAR